LKKKRQKIYKQLVESTAGIWKTEEGLIYQERLRIEWGQLLEDSLPLKKGDEDNLPS
jgi:hypothetical protein